MRCCGRCHAVSEIFTWNWQRWHRAYNYSGISLEWRLPRHLSDISKGSRNIYWGHWIEFHSHVKNNALIKKDLKRKTWRYDLRVFSTMTKVNVLILFAQRCRQITGNDIHISTSYCNACVHAGDGIERRAIISIQETITCF